MDPTGFYYYGARYYDPATGRFTTRDPVFGDLTDPQSLNRYSYCRNNPHKYVDKNGRDWIPSSELYQLLKSAESLPPEEAALYVIAGGILIITSHVKAETDRRIKAYVAGGYDAFSYGMENDWDTEGMYTHFEIGTIASYQSSVLGGFGTGVEEGIKRRLQQKAYLEGKPGITSYPPDYSEEEFLMDTLGGIVTSSVSVSSPGDPVSRYVYSMYNNAVKLLEHWVKERYYEYRGIPYEVVQLPDPPDYRRARIR
jgi:RHS repeat-associated protein